MLIDPLDWELANEITSQWVLLPGGHHHLYVASGTKEAEQLSRTLGDHTVLILSRYLMGAGRGQVVRFRDHDTLNLTRRNLVVFDRRTGERVTVEDGDGTVH